MENYYSLKNASLNTEIINPRTITSKLTDSTEFIPNSHAVFTALDEHTALLAKDICNLSSFSEQLSSQIKINKAELNAYVVNFNNSLQNINIEINNILNTVNYISGDMVQSIYYDINKISSQSNVAVNIAKCAQQELISADSNISKLSNDIHEVKDNISDLCSIVVNDMSRDIAKISGDLSNITVVQNDVKTMQSYLCTEVDVSLKQLKDEIYNNGIKSNISTISNEIYSGNGINKKISAISEDVDSLSTTLFDENGIINNVAANAQNICVLKSDIYDENGISDQVSVLAMSVENIIDQCSVIVDISNSLTTTIDKVDSQSSDIKVNQHCISNLSARYDNDISNIYSEIDLAQFNVNILSASFEKISGDMSSDVKNLQINYEAFKQQMTTTTESVCLSIDRNTNYISELSTKFSQMSSQISGDIHEDVRKIQQNLAKTDLSISNMSNDIKISVDSINNNIADVRSIVARVYKPKGSCTWSQLLTKSDSVEGDVWNITDKDNENYVRLDHNTTPYNDPSGWDSLGKEFDLSEYAKIGSDTDTKDSNTIKGVKKYADTKVEANASIASETNCKITYDSKGLVTSSAKLDASDIPNLAASKITSGTFSNERIPDLATSKITSGTFSNERIPNLDANKITSGTLSSERLPIIIVDELPESMINGMFYFVKELV